jgi:Protein similar to CwfJ C-terminus 1
VEIRDPKTGGIVRYNADDDSTTLGEMLRQEKFGAGMADQKDLDAQLAHAIVTDGKFEASPAKCVIYSSLSFMCRMIWNTWTITLRNLEGVRLKQMPKSEISPSKVSGFLFLADFVTVDIDMNHVRQIMHALRRLWRRAYIASEMTSRPPKAAVVALGTRVYLACTITQELVDGHCHIVPIQHHLSMLEGDDDLWEEVKVKFSLQC